MSRIRVALENQVFYRNLTSAEWNIMRGRIPRQTLEACLQSQDHPETMIKINRIAFHYLNPAILPKFR